MAPADIARINEVADHRERIRIGERAIAALWGANRQIDDLRKQRAELQATVALLEEKNAQLQCRVAELKARLEAGRT